MMVVLMQCDPVVCSAVRSRLRAAKLFAVHLVTSFATCLLYANKLANILPRADVLGSPRSHKATFFFTFFLAG